ncbi:MAG: LPXTG cell wall anchor domain-containing protein [Oscillospiraceae bacterium]|nr:LPXTG cell wall anchor domain-containing protein [Oscillospiraceae bacterium]
MKKIIKNSKYNIYKGLALTLCLCMLITGIIGIFPALATDYLGVAEWMLFDKNNSQIGAVNLWNQGSWNASSVQDAYIILPKRDLSKTTTSAVASELVSDYRVSVSANSGHRYKITAANYNPSKSTEGELWFFNLTINTEGDKLRWNWNASDVTFNVVVPDVNGPSTYTRVANWRIVTASDGQEVVEAGYGNSTVALPGRITGDQAATYADTLLKRYRLQVRMEYEGSYTSASTYNIRRIDYAGFDGSKYKYKIITKDTFVWTNNNSVEFYVTIKDINAAGERYNMSHTWGLVGDFTKTIAVGNALHLTDVDYENDVKGKETGYAATLKARFAQVRVQQGEGSWPWHTSDIQEIEYIGSGNMATESRPAAVYRIKVYDDFYDTNGKKIDYFDIVIYGPTDFGDLSEITVTPREPDGVEMNLFDYWPVTDNPLDEKGNPWKKVENWEPEDEKYNGGINNGHALKFFYTSPTNKNPGDQATLDKIASYGVWNHSTEDARQNVTGIVEKSLYNGFPKLNLNSKSGSDIWSDFTKSTAKNLRDDLKAAKPDGTTARTESLAYLFDPTKEHPGKASYTNVSGLLQMNQYGYYYYDSKLNFAEFDTNTHEFLLYNNWGVKPGGNSPDGQFFPFNNIEQVFSGAEDRKLIPREDINSRDEIFNHFFGFTMEVSFQQPANGQVNHGYTGQDMIFRFAGDDDVWIFVDDVLVLDLGGVHSGVYGDINFATGQVRTGLMANGDNVSEDNVAGAEGALMADHMPDGGTAQWENTTLVKLFEDAGAKSTTTWKGVTFADNTLHTIKLFYMERGHWDSNFAMYFNLQPEIPHRIYKVNEGGEPLPDAEFDLYEAEKIDSSYKEGETYHTSSEFKIKDESSPLAALTTGDDGYVLFPGNIDFAERAGNGQKYYILQEKKAPAGYKNMRYNIVLEYNSERNVFNVLNQYETGSYASFSAIIEDNEPTLEYALLDVTENTTDDNTAVDFRIDKTGIPIRQEHQKHALMFAVPMIYTDLGNGTRWHPIYGSNTEGYHAIDLYQPEEFFNAPSNKKYKSEDLNNPASEGYQEAQAWAARKGKDASEFFDSDDNKKYQSDDFDNPASEGFQEAWRWALRHNLLATALRQTSYTSSAPDWYFQSELVSDIINGKTESKLRFTSILRNLPGDSNRYLVHRENGDQNMNGADLRLVALLVDDEAIASILSYDKENPVDVATVNNWDDKTKYAKLEAFLQRPIFNGLNYEDNWDERFDPATGYDLPIVKGILNAAYTENGDSTRNQGVNLANINSFTRYYGSVIYIPNVRRELRLLKQNTTGNPLSGARFGLFDTFTKAALYDPLQPDEAYKPYTTGTTDAEGMLIFNIDGSTNGTPGSAYVNWEQIRGEDDDALFWIKELTPPAGYKRNESIVQVYAGDTAVFANASAYKPDIKYKGDGSVESVTPVLIDNDIVGLVPSGTLNEEGNQKLAELQSGGTYNTDKVTVRATIGHLYQTMQKYADSMLNTTLLDVDTRDSLYIASTGADDFNKPESGRYGNWHRVEKEGYDGHHRHFWGNAVRYTSSDYSIDHKRVDNDSPSVFSTTENGYLFMTPTQTRDELFREQHKGERSTLNSRRDILYMNDGTPVDISGVFAPVNVIVMQDEADLPGALSVGKTVTDDPNEQKRSFKFKVTLTHTNMELIGDSYPYRALGGVDESGAIKWTRTDDALIGEFELSNEQTITIYNLPEGTIFTVEEIYDGEDYADDYTLDRVDTSSTDTTVDEDKKAHGTIIEDTTKGVQFVNKPLAAPTETPSVDLPSTGGRGVTWLVLLGSFMLTMVIVYQISRKRKKQIL